VLIKQHCDANNEASRWHPATFLYDSSLLTRQLCVHRQEIALTFLVKGKIIPPYQLETQSQQPTNQRISLVTKISPEKQRIAGIGLLIFALAMTYWVWQNAMTTGSYLKIAAFVFPAFAVLGLAMAIYLWPKAVRRITRARTTEISRHPATWQNLRGIRLGGRHGQYLVYGRHTAVLASSRTAHCVQCARPVSLSQWIYLLGCCTGFIAALKNHFHWPNVFYLV